MARPERDNTVSIKQVLLILTCLILSTRVAGGFEPALDEIDRLIRLRDYPAAVVNLLPLVEKGNSEARYRLANLYRSGKGVKKNLDKATDLYLESAKEGHSEAQYVLALIIEKSGESSTSLIEARHWYKKSAAQGHPRAGLKLRQMRAGTEITGRNVNSSDIFNAIQHNDEALIHSLISRGIDLNLFDQHGNSTVMAALLAGWPRLANTLIANSNNFDRSNKLGNRPLHVAAARGYEVITDVLLDNDVDVNPVDSRGDTPLILALRKNNIGIARSLLEHGARHDLGNDRNKTAVDIAYAGDHPAAEILFASFGIRPRVVARPESEFDLASFKDSVRQHGSRYAGWPLLNIAIELGETRAARQLLLQNSDPDSTDPEGNNALHVAARKGDSRALKQLVTMKIDLDATNSRNETALYLAVESGSLDNVNLLLANKADPSIANGFEVSPLEAAVRKGQLKIAIRLLKSNKSYTGIHQVLLLAIQKKMEALSLALIRKDKQLELLDDNRRSVLWHSSDMGLERTTARLLELKRIDIDQKDVNGRSALSQAIIRGHTKVAIRLIIEGADLNARTNTGNTYLMLAVLSKRPEIVQYLLNRGIEADARNKLGDTAVMLAAANAQNEMVKLLIEAGADLQLRNNEELNAFQIATNAGHLTTANIIHDSSNALFKLFN